MKNKIPPPIVTLLFALCIYFFENYFSKLQLDSFFYIGVSLELLGLGIITSAVLSFRKNKTTVNPLKPNAASDLVIEGMFRFSRNPMYLGMLLILIGHALQFNVVGGFIFVPLFVLFLTIFQILPEEEAMMELFGVQFREYKKNVRRWI